MHTPDTVTCPMYRFKGRTITEIAEEDPDYLQWALVTTDWGRKNYDLIRGALRRVYASSADTDEPEDEDAVLSQEGLLEKAARTTCPMRKFRGATVVEIAEEEPGYLRWALKQTDWGAENRFLIEAALRERGLEKLRDVPAPALTDHQRMAVDNLQTAYGIGYRVLKLMGGAGYGKSYAVGSLARYFIERGYLVHACAVSYVATEVLREQLDPLGVSCATLARTLRFEKRWIDGQEVYEHSEDTPDAAKEVLLGQRVLIVDECSMIPDRDANLIFQTLFDGVDREVAGVLILVGDRSQLPPVKQDTPSLCCLYDNPLYAITAELTVPMRYSVDSHLYAVEQMSRTDPWSLFDGHAIAGQSSPQVTEADSIEDMIDDYVRNFERDPTASHRMLLFRRRDVVDANNRIRYKIFGERAEAIEKDERLMVLSTTDYPYRRPNSDGSAPINNTRYYSGTVYRVDEIERGEYNIPVGGETFEIPHYRVRFSGSSAWVSIIFGITETRADPSKTGSPEYEAAVRAAIAYGKRTDEYGANVGDWEPLRKLKADFVLMAYTYATSVHRCQGQTLDYAYTAPKSLLGVRAPMGPALTYVACTRAKKHLTIVR